MTSIAAAHRADMERFSTTAAVAGSAEPDATAPMMAAESPPSPAPAPEAKFAEPDDKYGWNVSMPPASAADEPAIAPSPTPTDEPVTVVAAEDAPALAPADRTIEAAPAIEVAPPSGDIETVAARRIHRRARKRSRMPVFGLPTAVLALIAVNFGLIAWRTEVVRWMPQMASLYSAIGLPVNLRGLAFTDITTRRETQDGVQVLVVEGFIQNETRRPVQVPRLRFAVRNTSGQEIYSWTSMPARSTIPSGTMLPFRSRLASPPPEAHEVLVRFFNKRDLIAGIQ
jgi:hypothetical protein